MSPRKLIAVISVWFLIGSLSSDFARAETLDRIVAVVNSDIILYGDLQEQLTRLEKISGNPPQDPAMRAKIEREVLESMVQQRLTEQEAKRLKIAVSNSEVDMAIEGIKREHGFTDAQMQYMNSQEGQTMAQFREKIRTELQRAKLIEKVIRSKIVITEEQVNARLQSGKESNPATERRRLAVIFLPIPEKASTETVAGVEKLANKILADLKGGVEFGKLAGEYSQGPAAKEGGDIGYISSDELMPAIDSAVRRLQKGEFSEIIKTPGGLYIIKVLGVEKERRVSNDTDQLEKIHRQIYQEEVNRKFEKWIKDLESKSFIQINL
jgi:peptidyl-prolyl cis-trans isomerase SurA